MPPEAIALPEQAAAPAQLQTQEARRAEARHGSCRESAQRRVNVKTTAAAESLKAKVIEPVSTAMETTPNAAAESASKVAVQTVTSVTTPGCLANDEETFLEEHHPGADAPKSRSWRSGF